MGKDAWGEILRHQLDSRHGPCNFVALVQRKPDRPLHRVDEKIGNRTLG